MRIAILGCGAAGSVIAGYLKKGGAEDITLIDLYTANMDTIAEKGLRFQCPEGECTLNGFHTAYSADEVGIVDILILMVKCTQTEAALSSAQSCIGPETVIVTLQNGLGNDEKCKKFVALDRIIMGCGNIGTELAGPGACVAKPHPGLNMYLGPCEKSVLNDQAGAYLERCFREGGLRPRYFEDVRPYIWKKATSNCSNNTVCAVLGLKIGEVEADPYGRQLTRGVFREAADVAEAMGIHGIWEYILEDQVHVVESLGDYYPSMAQDMLINQRQTEVDYMTGAIPNYGRQVNIPTPTCDLLTCIVKAKQANYDRLYVKKEQ